MLKYHLKYRRAICEVLRESGIEMAEWTKSTYKQLLSMSKPFFLAIDKVLNFFSYPYFLLPNNWVLCPCRAVCNFPLLWCKLVILRVTQSDTLFPLPLLELGPELLLQIQTENSECIFCVLDRCKFISYYYSSMKMIINFNLITIHCSYLS